MDVRRIMDVRQIMDVVKSLVPGSRNGGEVETYL